MAHSRSVEEVVEKKEKIIQIENGVNLEEFELKNSTDILKRFEIVNKPYILFLSRIHPKKGIELLLNSFKDQNFFKLNGFNEYNFLSIFIPNSYNFYWDTDATSFRSRMLKEYNLFWNDSRIRKLKQIGLTQNQVMILASIVTQESKMKSELNTIAGVYMNRLNNNWLLQADPTVKYAAYQLPAYKNTIIRRILYKHLKIESKFNTYKYKGLPPGPICIPSINSIDAVLNASNHDYIFMCAKEDFSGYHNFAISYADHLKNAKKYRNALNNKGIKR